MNKLLVLLACCMLLLACKKQKKNEESTPRTSIVGVDNCTLDYPSDKRGYILRIVDRSEDVLVYGLPKEIADKVEKSITNNLIDYCYFQPESYQPVKITYRLATKEEIFYPICDAIIPIAGISKIKTQIILTSIHLD